MKNLSVGCADIMVKRYIWIDNIKLFACILVASGHFFMSMTTGRVISDTRFYNWFITTIYYFHVPLFFICSGYLYQKTPSDNSFTAWMRKTVKKLISLGIPYFVFSLATWLLKEIFSSQVNTENEGLFKSLFLFPLSPYWYLYALFLIFLITPCFKNKKMLYTGVITAVVLKIISVFFDFSIYAVSTVLQNEIWFVIGMTLAMSDADKILSKSISRLLGGISAVFFIVFSVIIAYTEIGFYGLDFLMGVLGCAASVILIFNFEKQLKFVNGLSRYTMPIFLMHTIFAAGLRSILFKIGIENAGVHILLGLFISFAGPILASEIMRILKLDVFYNPQKYIKLKF